MSATATNIHSPPNSGDAHLQHQFKNADQQRESATLGMWLFLGTEVLFFGGLFVSYAIYRVRWPDDFREGSLDLKWYLGGLNTAILLLSSFFMALGVRASQQGDNRRVIRHLLATIALAVAFLGVKGMEYYLEYDEGLVPGESFRLQPPPRSSESALTRGMGSFERWTGKYVPNADEHGQRTRREQLFMCFYFIMTAIHATHMLIGIGLMTWLMMLARRRAFSAAWHNPVEVVGLYWHFVDTVWVFLFPVLYLLRNP
ncbi:MAG TPA: cytochrome c oxidase subunit 3 family protein [Tepidisphaeraceae bacterium]|jgi:cytochrome c oxidase subunit 3|nr:cytochrome c oxidase subunit 3 family protein [Tepidisphaeraceae bacterium]